MQTRTELESWFGRIAEATVPMKELERLLAESYRDPAQALKHSWETSSHVILLGPVDKPTAFMLGRFEMFDYAPACYLAAISHRFL
jgi:hypothetical protein